MSTGGLAKPPTPDPHVSLARAASSGHELPPAFVTAEVVPPISGLLSRGLTTFVQRKKTTATTMAALIRFFIVPPGLIIQRRADSHFGAIPSHTDVLGNNASLGRRDPRLPLIDAK